MRGSTVSVTPTRLNVVLVLMLPFVMVWDWIGTSWPLEISASSLRPTTITGEDSTLASSAVRSHWSAMLKLLCPAANVQLATDPSELLPPCGEVWMPP